MLTANKQIDNKYKIYGEHTKTVQQIWKMDMDAIEFLSTLQVKKWHFPT